MTHESDLDGLLAGWLLQRLAEKRFGVRPPLQSFHYQAWKQRVLAERVAWVTDLSFETRLDRPGWLVVDHHPLEGKPRQATLVHDPAKSASLLCYELCREAGLGSPVLDRLVHLSDVADLFRPEDPDFVEATDYANLVKAYGFWTVHALSKGEPEGLVGHPLLQVMRVRREIEDPLGFAWCRENLVPITDTVAYVPTLVGNTNTIVHRLLHEPGMRFKVLLTLLRKGGGGIVVSLRSRDGEAAVLAGKLQGGGHPNAAGAVLPRFVQTIPDALDYLKQALVPAPPLPADGKGLTLDELTL